MTRATRTAEYTGATTLCLYLAFEESPSQIVRNMASAGIHLARHQAAGLLRFNATRSTFLGLEQHLVNIHDLVEESQPDVVIVDPVSNLINSGNLLDVKAMLTRLIDFLKMSQITVILTNLTSGGGVLEQTDVGISSLADTWLLLRDIEIGGERNRGLYILKSRGMAHSNQIREFLLTDEGINLLDVYVGPSGVLTGSARVAQEAQERADAITDQQEIELKKRNLESKRRALEAQLAALHTELRVGEEEMKKLGGQEKDRQRRFLEEQKAIARMRRADRDSARGGPK